MTTPHDTFREQLLDLAYGELGRRETRALRAHLETCDACRAELGRMNATRSAMAGLGTEPAPARGENVLLAAAREAARARAPKPLLPSWAWGASIGALAAAAVVVLSVKLAPGVRMRTGEPDPGALVSSSPAPEQAPPAAAPAAPAEEARPAAGEEVAANEPFVREESEAKAAPRPPAKPRDGKVELHDERRDEVASAERKEAPGKQKAGPSSLDRAVGGLSEKDADRFAAAPPAASPAPAAPPPAAERPFAAAEAAPDDEVSKFEGGGKRATLEDAEPRRSRASAAGDLRAVARTSPPCPGESWRLVETDAAGRVVKVTRRGTAEGEPFVLEQLYDEDGALAVVRWSSEGRVHEVRLGPAGPVDATGGVPAFALLPRRAEAALRTPPRCAE